MQARRGFTLIELMIVIAIIAIIAAIAIPNLLESRKAGNEASAIQTLRAIYAGETLFKDRDMDNNNVQDFTNGSGDLTRLKLIPDSVFGPANSLVAYNGYVYGCLGTAEGF